MRIISRLTPAKAVLAAACAMLLLASGCGSEDETTSESTAAADSEGRAEFIAAADQICAATGARLSTEIQKAVPENADEATRKEFLAIFTDLTLPGLEQQYEEIAALPVPEGDEEEVEAILAEAKSAITESKKDPIKLLVLSGESTPFDELNQLQVEYGFEVCGAPDPEAG